MKQLSGLIQNSLFNWSSALVAVACLAAPAHAVPLAAPIATDLKAQIESRALRYFLENANPISGLVRDSADNFQTTPADNRMASIAATGFGLAVIANAGTRGMMTTQAATDAVLKTMKFTRDHVARHNGWFLHFVDWQSGDRLGNSEFSTIDTALFLGGALYAGQVLGNAEISTIAHELYQETDFNEMLTDGGASPSKLTLSMAWAPETGYTPAQWSMPAEEMLLLLLGLGHPTHPLPEKAWLAWDRGFKTLSDGEKLIGFDMPLFTHQYSQVFVDFRHFRDAYANYFDNSSLATRVNKETCAHDTTSETFKAGFWGLSAGESPSGYNAFDPTRFNTTACIGCAVGSAMYSSVDVLADVKTWLNSPYHDQIWGRYGLVDSVDLDQKWFAKNVLGITVGPEYMSLANMSDSTSIWKGFSTIPEIRTALSRAAEAHAPTPTVTTTTITTLTPKVEVHAD